MWRPSPVRSGTRWVVVAAILLGACSPVSSGGEVVQVRMVDFGITTDPSTVAPGAIDLAIVNDGDLVHEVEVFGGVDDEQPLDVSDSIADTRGLDLIDEVEDVLPSSTARLALDLPPGTYLVICNLPGHYEQGMSTYLTVDEGPALGGS
jgi:uncharacterized cupredoxin-like copper-binding protein